MLFSTQTVEIEKVTDEADYSNVLAENTLVTSQPR